VFLQAVGKELLDKLIHDLLLRVLSWRLMPLFYFSGVSLQKPVSFALSATV
jgi:hypothetical protein